jgi:hypothetical protein
MFKPESPTESRNLQEIIDFRFKQRSADRLIEYITGMRLDDPGIGDRLLMDRKIIREKYHFPQTRGELVDYERFLKSVAKEKGVLIRNKSDCGSFFKDYPESGGVYFGDANQIGVDIDTATTESYRGDLVTLEHELIHALQRKYYPRMSSEIREYEAYVTGINIEGIRKYFDNIQSPLLTFLAAPLLGSVHHSYKENSKKEGFEIKPEWDNPYYFLEKVDKLDPAEIEAIRLSKLE